jgi:rubrerythrin
MLEAYHALRYARENELRAMEYYSSVAANANDPVLARLAREFANEETEHVAALDDWIARTPRPSATWEEDPDPLPPAG